MRVSIFVVVTAISAVATALVANDVNWVTKLGALAQDTTQVRGMMEQVDASEQPEFAGRLLRAANTLPLTPDAKNERIARIAHELVAGAKTVDEKIATLSTIFTKTAPMYLSGVADTLSVGLEVGRNGLAQESFLNIATNVIADVERRTVGDPDQLLRVTMTISTFLRAAGTTLNLEPSLLAALSDAGLAALIQPVVGEAVKGNYDPMLQANADEKSGGAIVFAPAIVAASGEPLFFVTGIPSVGVGGWLTGIGGSSFKGVDARPDGLEVEPPKPPDPYRGQCLRCTQP